MIRRYQECPWYTRAWRRRWYAVAAWRWLAIVAHRPSWGDGERLTWGDAWAICAGMVEAKRMHWYFTSAELDGLLEKMK